MCQYGKISGYVLFEYSVVVYTAVFNSSSISCHMLMQIYSSSSAYPEATCVFPHIPRSSISMLLVLSPQIALHDLCLIYCPFLSF